MRAILSGRWHVCSILLSCNWQFHLAFSVTLIGLMVCLFSSWNAIFRPETERQCSHQVINQNVLKQKRKEYTTPPPPLPPGEIGTFPVQIQKLDGELTIFSVKHALKRAWSPEGERFEDPLRQPLSCFRMEVLRCLYESHVVACFPVVTQWLTWEMHSKGSVQRTAGVQRTARGAHTMETPYPHSIRRWMSLQQIYLHLLVCFWLKQWCLVSPVPHIRFCPYLT